MKIVWKNKELILALFEIRKVLVKFNRINEVSAIDQVIKELGG